MTRHGNKKKSEKAKKHKCGSGCSFNRQPDAVVRRGVEKNSQLSMVIFGF